MSSNTAHTTKQTSHPHARRNKCADNRSGSNTYNNYTNTPSKHRRNRVGQGLDPDNKSGELWHSYNGNKYRSNSSSSSGSCDDLTSISSYKLKPSFYNGDYGTFEEWTAGLMDNVYTRLLQASETATAELTDAQL